MRAEIKYGAIFFAVALVVITWRVLAADDDVRQIDRTMRNLAGWVEKSPGESRMDGLGRGRRVAAVFVDGATIEYLPGRVARVQGDAFAGTFVGARSQVRSISISIRDHSIDVSPQGDRAESTVRARAQVDMGGDSHSMSYRYAVDWVKIDDTWQIAAITLLERLN